MVVKTNPVMVATRKVNPRRMASICPKPKAEAVLAITTGLMTGAASRKAMPLEIGSPFLYRRRTSGTTPHSHTGKTNPIRLPATALKIGERPLSRSKTPGLTNTSTMPEASVPNSRKGRASMKMPRNTVAKFVRLSVRVPRKRHKPRVASKTSRTRLSCKFLFLLKRTSVIFIDKVLGEQLV